MQANPGADRRTRWTVAALVILLHVGLVAGLIRAFTPRFAAQVRDTVTQAFTVSVTPIPTATPSPPPRPLPEPSAEPEPEGAAAPPGRQAIPREVAAPPARVILKPTSAPPVAGPGDENAAGANVEGSGTGAAGSGQGTGAGASGSGQGIGGQGGGGSPTVKVKGDINSARDYPRATRDLRIGAAVTIDLLVDTEGRVRSCRVVQPSPDPAADRITCELATKRFRFRPARDAAGQPVESTYRWRQRWFY